MLRGCVSSWLFVGIMTRCAIQGVSCMHGHLDTLIGSPWCHGACGFLVLVFCMCMAYLIHLDAVKTHTTWLHSHCLLALRAGEAHWGFDELSTSYPGESNRLGTGRARVRAG